MTAINSNRAIRGPVTAVPVVAGKGVRLVADTENNRWVVEADETVLFSDDTGSGSLTLSETPMNFERLKIFFGTPRTGTAGSNTGMSYTEVLTSTLEGGRQGGPSAGYLTFQGVFYGTNSSQSNPYISVGQFSGCNTTTWTRGSSGTIFKLSDKSVATDSQWVAIYKIIGVNRIASN